MASTQAAKQIVWLRQLLTDLGCKQRGATVLYSDNTSAIALSKNPAVHPRTKHIDIQWFWVREKVHSGEITVTHCSTEDMTADVLTKPLGRIKHQLFTRMLGLVSL